jgi:hypothetical protein
VKAGFARSGLVGEAAFFVRYMVKRRKKVSPHTNLAHESA